MKECPDCGASNQPTNLFCPLCGHSFIDEQNGQAFPRQKRSEKWSQRRVVAAVLLVVLIVGASAGFVSYFVSRAIENGKLVTVEAGTIWKCSRCGKIYKDRVFKLNVKKSESGNYEVETVDGLCYNCKYGADAGKVQILFEWLSHEDYFHGFMIDVEDASAAYIASHPGFFPAADPRPVAGLADEVAPQLVERDFSSYTGKPVSVTGKVTSLEVIKGVDGSKTTFMEMLPRYGGKEYDVEYFVIYRGGLPVKSGDVVCFALLPVDLARYMSAGVRRNAVVTIALSAEKVTVNGK